MKTNLKDEATVGNQQTQAGEEFTPLTKQKLFDGVVLSKLTGTPICEIEKDSDSYWYKYTRNDAGQELTYEDSDNYWCKYTRNAAGQELTYENSDSYWRKYTYDAAGQILIYKTSDDYWCKYTYNAAGQILIYKTSDGIFHQYIAQDRIYGLRFEEGRYKAGCRDFSYEEAVQHWTERSADEDKEISNRANLFLKAIAEHQEKINQSNT